MESGIQTLPGFQPAKQPGRDGEPGAILLFKALRLGNEGLKSFNLDISQRAAGPGRKASLDRTQVRLQRINHDTGIQTTGGGQRLSIQQPTLEQTDGLQISILRLGWGNRYRTTRTHRG